MKIPRLGNSSETTILEDFVPRNSWRSFRSSSRLLRASLVSLERRSRPCIICHEFARTSVRPISQSWCQRVGWRFMRRLEVKCLCQKRASGWAKMQISRRFSILLGESRHVNRRPHFLSREERMENLISKKSCGAIDQMKQIYLMTTVASKSTWNRSKSSCWFLGHRNKLQVRATISSRSGGFSRSSRLQVDCTRFWPWMRVWHLRI